jgi:hypothetical protein
VSLPSPSSEELRWPALAWSDGSVDGWLVRRRFRGHLTSTPDICGAQWRAGAERQQVEGSTTVTAIASETEGGRVDVNDAADGEGEDPRKAIDDLIDPKAPWTQWLVALDAASGELTEERKWDIVEWMLLETRVNDMDIERASGLPPGKLPDVRSTDFGTEEEPSKAYDRNRGLLTRIKVREEAGKRTNTSDLAGAISRDRAEMFGDCASARISGYVTFGPPDFQWTITSNGLRWLKGPMPPEDLLEEQGAD